LIKHKNEPAILVGCDILKREMLASKLIEMELFDYVIDYPYKLAFDGESEEDVLTTINNCFDPKFEEKQIDIGTISKIYTSDDVHNAFAIYLDGKNIDYTWIEPTENKSKVYARYNHRFSMGVVSQGYYNLYRKTAPITTNGKCVKSVILFPNTDLKDNLYVERFDFNANFLKIPDDKKIAILNCFDIDIDLFKSNNISLYLPNSTNFVVDEAQASGVRVTHLTKGNDVHFVLNHSYCPEKVDSFTATLCDYFIDRNNTILCKQHPYSEVNFEKIFDGKAKILDKDMPIEFLLLVPNIKISQLLSVYTTAAVKLGAAVENDVQIGRSFRSVFYFYNKLFVTMNFILNNMQNKEIRYYGIPREAMDRFYQYGFDNLSDKAFIRKNEINSFTDNNCYLISPIPTENKPIIMAKTLIRNLKKASDDCVIIFPNAIEEYCFCSLDELNLLDYITPIVIKRIPIKDHPLCDISDEVIYVFSKNASNRKLAQEMVLSKTLDYSGVELVVEPISEERILEEKQRCIDAVVKQDIQRQILYQTVISEHNASAKLAEVLSFYQKRTGIPFLRFVNCVAKVRRRYVDSKKRLRSRFSK